MATIVPQNQEDVQHAERHPGRSFDSQTQKTGSRFRSFGRLTDRWSTASCRKARFWATSTALPAMRALRKAKTIRTMPVLAPPSITWRPVAETVSPCSTGLKEFSAGAGARHAGRRRRRIAPASRVVSVGQCVRPRSER